MCDSSNGDLLLYDAATQKYQTTLKKNDRGLIGVAFHPNNTIVAVGSFDHTASLWDIESMALHPNGDLVALGGLDTHVHLWTLDQRSWEERACAIANRDLTPAE